MPDDVVPSIVSPKHEMYESPVELGESDDDFALHEGMGRDLHSDESRLFDQADKRDRKGKGKEKEAQRPSFHETEPEPPTPPVRSNTRAKRESRSWSDLDLSMVVALVSPIGNWLTGGDHVKNVFLLLLLIFYLHQLIEVPWQLYHRARVTISPRAVKKLDGATDPSARFALSELRSLELFYLSLTIIAPFLGATLIHIVFDAMAGVESLSWFSTTLFVLATGVRPWSHLMTRFQQRTEELDEALQEPLREQEEHGFDRKLDLVMKRLDAMEHILAEVRGKASRIQHLHELYEELDDTLGDAQRSIMRHERKTDAFKVSQGRKIAALEVSVSQMEERNKRELSDTAHTTSTTLTITVPPVVAQLISMVYQSSARLLAILFGWVPYKYIPQVSGKNHAIALKSASPPFQSDPDNERYFNGTPLETIPEAIDSDSEGTYVSEKNASGTSALDQEGNADSPGESSPKRGNQRRRGQRMSYHEHALDSATIVVAWPYQAAVKVLSLITPPMLKEWW